MSDVKSWLERGYSRAPGEGGIWAQGTIFTHPDGSVVFWDASKRGWIAGVWLVQGWLWPELR